MQNNTFTIRKILSGMTQSICKIHVDGIGYPEFHFTRIYTVSGVRYHVSVFDRALKSHHFTMERVARTWKIIQPSKLPAWIIGVEKELSDSICRFED